MSELFQVFPIPIYCNKAEGDTFEEIQDELKGVCDNLEFAQMENWSRDTHELNKDPFEGNIIEKYNCEKFSKFFSECVCTLVCLYVGTYVRMYVCTHVCT